ncbi:MAG: DNA polymerase III subunit epsilon [Ferrimonas sp.]
MTLVASSKRQVIFDTETTGMNQGAGAHYLGHRLVEIGCIEMINRKLTGRTFHVYVKPDRPVDKEAFEVHGISDEFLADKPTFAEVADDFFEFIHGAELIAHNANFDMGFINHEFEMVGRHAPIEDHCSVVDTLQLARELKNRGELQGHLNLDALCRFYGIDNSHRTLHGALLDSEILADVYLYLTGGQVKLQFGQEGSAQTEAFTPIKEGQRRAKVIRASAEEVNNHQTRMEMVSDAIWFR